MTLTVTLTAQQGQGIDFNDYVAQHFSDFIPHGMPLFNTASDSEETTQIVHLATPETGAEADTRLVALEGQDFTYTFSNHTISGTIETIRLGTLGAAWDQETQDVVLTNGLLTTASTAVTLSGFNITNAVGVAGAVHEIVAGLMGGGPNGGAADASGLLEAVFGQAHDVRGSTAADIYSGTRFGDTVQGRGGDDELWGLRGNDLLKGQAGADALQGGAGSDTLAGGAGADTLAGGTGRDRLTGGSGADHFVFGSPVEAKGDTITDFAVKGGDVMNLSGLEGDLTFIGTEGFSGEAGELRFVIRGGDTRVQADLDGDGRADFNLVLSGAKALTVEDFLL